MRKYLWFLHIVTGLLALFTSILRTDDFFRLCVLLSILSVSSLLGLVLLSERYGQTESDDQHVRDIRQ